MIQPDKTCIRQDLVYLRALTMLTSKVHGLYANLTQTTRWTYQYQYTNSGLTYLIYEDKKGAKI